MELESPLLPPVTSTHESSALFAALEKDSRSRDDVHPMPSLVSSDEGGLHLPPPFYHSKWGWRGFCAQREFAIHKMQLPDLDLWISNCKTCILLITIHIFLWIAIPKSLTVETPITHTFWWRPQGMGYYRGLQNSVNNVVSFFRCDVTKHVQTTLDYLANMSASQAFYHPRAYPADCWCPHTCSPVA